MSRFAHPLPFGAELLSRKETRFRLWAPSVDSVALDVQGMKPVAMERQSGGWFEVIVSCGAGAKYRFKVAPELSVPDVASRYQAGDIHDYSVVIDPKRYVWKHPSWKGRPWHETVLYELHAGLLGGFKGVGKELPRLKELGVTAVELMPINDFPGKRNWGYDGVLPFAPDSAYGTPEDLKALVDAAHGLGMMIFLDVVYNHFGPDGNYLPVYAASFFNNKKSSPWGAAIDFHREPVRDFFIQNAKYWLYEYRFDGLRFDATDQIKDDSFLAEMAERIRASIEPGRHVHLVLENGENVAGQIGWTGAPARRNRSGSAASGGFNAQWCDDIHHAFHTLLTGEIDGYYIDYAEKPAEKLARALAEGFIYQGEKSVFQKGKKRGRPSAHLPSTSFVIFVQNHDQIGNRALGDRLATLAAPEALAAAHALLLLTPQIPMLFWGEERATKAPFNFFTDHHGALAKAVREGRRREFAGFGAFADEAMAARIPDPNAMETFKASGASGEAEEKEAASFSRFQQLLALRAQEITPHIPGAKSKGARAIGDAAIFANWRLGDDSQLVILTNLGGPAVPVGGRSLKGLRLLHESQAGAGQHALEGMLRGFTTVVFRSPSPAARRQSRRRS